MNYKTLIKEIVSSSKKPSNIIRANKELFNYINNTITDEMPFMEKVYLIINDETKSRTCKCGTRLRFESIFYGYKLCSNKTCKYMNDYIQEQTKKSNMKKYGVEYPFQLKEVQEKIQKTFKEKYNGNPVYDENIKNKIIKTNIERYGHAVPAKSELIRKKIINTLSKMAGSEIISPFSLPAIREKNKQNNLIRYGVEYPLQSKEVRKKINNNLQEKYGVFNPSYIGRDKIKNILKDKEKFIELVTTYESSALVAEYIDVDISTVQKYANIYDIGFRRTSKYEKEIEIFLTSLNINFKKNDRSLIWPKEIDFLIPEYNLGIELHGIYWHSEKQGKTKDYHYSKFVELKNKGFNLIQIYDNEWRDKTDIIKKYLINRFNKTCNKVGARKTNITEIKSSIANKFLNLHHIQGSTTQISKAYGAYYNTDLIGVMTFLNKKNEWELTRFATSINCPGLFSKMLKYFTNNNKSINIIKTFSDNRWFSGDLYYKTGWERVADILPTYFYTDYNNIWHRFNFRKNAIERKYGLDITNKTEKQLINVLGLDKIWDAGKVKWIYKL